VSLESIGWNRRLQSVFASTATETLVPARVVRVDRGLATAESGERTIRVSTAGTISPNGESGPPAVGDWVGLEPSGDGGVIRLILPRTGAMARRRPGAADAEQVVAANVDIVLVVESLERGPSPRRIERAAALAWDGGAMPLVVLTKADVCPDCEAAVERAREGAPYSDVLPVSAVTGAGIDAVAERMPTGTTSVLLGPSGVGKSTLINRLLGEDRLAVGEVRAGDAKGRHTTTHRELVVLPGGGCVIDTPGIRELGLWLDREAVSTVFPEIDEAACGCRFSDCRHESEPGCAVRRAVEAGDIDPRRLDSFLRLRREAENLERRRDESRRHEIRARERRFGKMVREVKKIKDRR
jgi:ribosome biogenesis GTPase